MLSQGDIYRHGRDSRFGLVILIIFQFSDFRNRRYRAFRMSLCDRVFPCMQRYANHRFALSSRTSVGTCRHQQKAQHPRAGFPLCLRPSLRTIVFQPRFQCPTLPISALLLPRLTHRPGIDDAVLYHDAVIRSCLFESGREQQDSRPEDCRGKMIDTVSFRGSYRWSSTGTNR